MDFRIGATRPGQIVTYEATPDTRYANIENTCTTGNENAIWLSRVAGGNQIVLRGETRSSLEVPVSVTIHDPPMFAGTVLAETLVKSGVRVAGSVQRDRGTHELYAQSKLSNDGAFSAVAVHETPLATVLARANKDSMNVYAEALCKRLGYEATKTSGSWENGAAAIGQFLQGIGVAKTEFTLDDGSGLSKQNTISPNAIVRVLMHNFTGAQREAFLSSLSVAGVDGTLEDRFRGSDLRGRVMGKSGYVNGVRALSGYLKTNNDQWYAFSILMNGPDGGNAAMKTIQERIVRAIDSNAGE
jgi:D-alanyl-D-alanine carboxypeptidase/D-alanyl-D-alanine-endopeptidase (penicillin-binding protein 4)